MEIETVPEIIIQSAQYLQQNLFFKFFTDPQNFVTLAVSLVRKFDFCDSQFFVPSLSAVLSAVSACA